MKVSEPSSQERQRILEAFIEVVAEDGYEGASIPAVAERAGVEEIAFRRHFADREDCFVAAWEYLTPLYMEAVFAAYESKDTWREQMRAAGLALVEYFAEHPHHARVLTAPAPGRRAWAVLERNIEVFVELIDLGRREMADPDMLTRATAEGLAGAVHEQLAQHVARGDIAGLRALVGPLMYMVIRPYLGDEAALEELRRG